MGLNTRSSVSADRPSGETPVPSAAAAPSAPGERERMRPSEMMLAEMARALNAGLGLASNTNTTAASSNSDERTSANDGVNGAHVLFPPVADSGSSLPPEGSFERFLANLQSDLRTILSEEPTAVQDSANASSAVQTDGAGSASEVTSARPSLDVHAPSRDEDGQSGRHGGDIPTLESDPDSDSENEFQDADEDVTDEASTEESTPHLRAATPMPSTGGIMLPQDQASTPEQTAQRRRERPAINLWRLYRFDPIPATHAEDHATRTSTNASPLRVDHDATRPTGVSLPASTPAGELSETPSEVGAVAALPPLSATPTPSVVVPVIVVGLQSVDVVDHDEPEDEPGVANPSHAGPSTIPSDAASQDGFPNPGRPTTPRGRTWQSRAANALRTWRPGRRGSRTRRNTEGTGSRTFLIYVIGGGSSLVSMVRLLLTHC